MTCRSKIAKIVPIENHGGRLKNLFFASPDPKGQLTQTGVGSFGVNFRSKIDKKKKIQDDHHLFLASSDELKGQSTRNLIESIGVTVRSK